MSDFGTPGLLSIAGDLRGEVGLEAILRRDEGQPDTLAITASSVDHVDASTATALQLRSARHLRQHPEGTVSVWMPTDAVPGALLTELMTPDPGKLLLVHSTAVPVRPRSVLLPATTIADTEAAVLAAEYLLNVCDALAIPSARAAAAAEAVMELSDNALRAAPGPDLPVVAATITGSPRTIRVAVTDAGETISEAANPQALLHAMPHARGGNGFLPTLLRKGDRFGFKVRIEIFAGTARLRWWWSGRQAPLGTRHIPGTTVIVVIAP